VGAPEIEFTRFLTDVYGGVSVELRGETLCLIQPERAWPVPLVPTGANGFRYPHQSGASIQFLRTDRGRRAVVIGQHYYEEQSAFWAGARKTALDLAVFILMSNFWVPLFLLWRRDLEETLVLLRPLLAALCLWGTSLAFTHAREEGVLGVVAPSTIAVWVLSWSFGLLSFSTLSRARVLAQARVHVFLRLQAIVTATAATWIALHLSRYGLIGLRTWRW
jgi:hypothetical protein